MLLNMIPVRDGREHLPHFVFQLLLVEIEYNQARLQLKST